jgi:hypothetical protein
MHCRGSGGFCVSTAFVGRLEQRFRQTGSLAPMPRQGRLGLQTRSPRLRVWAEVGAALAKAQVARATGMPAAAGGAAIGTPGAIPADDKMIVILSDRDLREMLQMKADEENPTEVIDLQLNEFLAKLAP